MPQTNKYEHERQLQDLSRILAKVNRVMAGDKKATVTVTHEGQGGPIASSLGSAVRLNADRITPTDVQDLTLVYGLNYHELGHILYTPKGLFDGLNAQARRCINILEDARLERLLTAQWPRTVDYLTAVIMRYIANEDDEDAVKQAHTLTWGRRYLPSEVRGAMREAFEKPEILGEIEEIIDEYLPLVLPREIPRAQELSRQLAQLLYDNEVQAPNPECHPDPNSAQRRSDSQQRMDQAIAQREDKEREEPEDAQDGEPEEQEDAQDGQEGDGADEGTPDDGEGQETDGEGQETDGEGQETDGDGDAEGDAGAAQQAKETAQQAARDLAKATVEAVMASSEVQREMKARQKSIVEHDLPYVQPERIRHHGNILEADTEVKRAARRFEEELQLLADKGGAAWERQTSSGRLNVQRAMGATVGLDELFDQWNEEGEGHDLEVVTLVDNSASMDTRGMYRWRSAYYDTSAPDVLLDKLASDCAWVLDRGIKSVEGSHTAITFGGKTGSLYRPDERPTRGPMDIDAAGGTDPLDAITQAVGILEASKRRNKLLIIITDGEWNGPVIYESHDLIRKLREQGVQTALAYLSDGRPQDVEAVRHECEVVDVIPDATALPRWAAGVVKAAMEKRLERR